MLTAKNTKPEEWVSRKELMERLRVSSKTISNKKSSGKIPAHAVKKGVTTLFHLPTIIHQ